MYFCCDGKVSEKISKGIKSEGEALCVEVMEGGLGIMPSAGAVQCEQACVVYLCLAETHH